MLKRYSATLTLIIFLFQSPTKAQNFTIIDTLPSGAYGTATWGDYDHDGFMDLAYLSQILPDVDCRIYHNQNNIFTQSSFIFTPLFNPAAQWADLDNDGFDDLVVCGLGDTFTQQTIIYRSLGNGNFSIMPHPIPSLSIGSIDVMDYNHDGWKDIAICGYDTLGLAQSFIFKNTGSFNFIDINASLIGMYGGELKWGDYNNDSLPDLVINGNEQNNLKLRFYRNMGSDIFQEELFNFPGTAGTVDWVDYNLDGINDLFISGVDSSFTHNVTALYQNDGLGNFTLTPTNIPDFGEPSAVTIADFNNDSIQDICLVGGNAVFNSYSIIAYGQGTSNFNLQPLPRAIIDNLFVEAADIDNDGDADLVMSTYILRNDLISTAVNSIASFSNNVLIYPNPASNIVKIISEKEISTYSVLDLQGRMILENGQAEQGKIISIKSLIPGIYSIKLIFKDGSMTSKQFNISH